jgi:ABC-type glycerol-3-phosphate transport system substrate-binding protein
MPSAENRGTIGGGVAEAKALTFPAARGMPSIVKSDPWWSADPHRAAYVQQGLLGPALPEFWAFNPAYAQVQNEHAWSTAWIDIMKNGMVPEAAAEKAFKRVEEIFAKYPIAQS